MSDSVEQNERHKAKMAKIKAARDRMMATKTEEKGLIMVHTGPGKGKSSSGFGMIMRCIAHEMPVAVVQFIKGKWITGERQFFDRLGEVTWHTMGEGFTWDTQDRDRDIAAAEAAFAKARDMMASGDYDLVVMDEINIALRYDYLKVEDVIAGLEGRTKGTTAVLTGRDAKPELCDYADLVTEMREVKHPFHSGIKAQRGVDF